MAEFGQNVTELPSPSGAGSQVVDAVRQAPTVAQDIGGSSPLLGSVVDIFAKGLIQNRKDEADKLKNTVVSGYIREETTLNDAVATGQMTAAQAAARSRANFNKYAAGYGQFIEDFEKAGKALRGFTEKGESEKVLETESKRKEADISEAQKRGFTFVAGMSDTAIDAQISAAKAGIKAERELSEMYRANAEKRAQGTFDQGIADREAKEMGFKIINEIAGSNLTAFQQFGTTLGDKVRKGEMAPEIAAAALAERFGNISGAIQAAARTNPELAAPFRSLFSEMNAVNTKLIDPKQNVEDLKNQLESIQTRMALIAMNDPRSAAVIMANKLIPNNPSLALGTAADGVGILSILSSTPVTSGGFVPPVVGNPQAEGPTLDLLKSAFKDIASGKITEKDIAITQASNSVNHILKQTGAVINKEGAKPQELIKAAQFFASPEYASFVTSGKIDKDAAVTAKKTFQLLYEPMIIDGVSKRLQETLDREPVMRGGQSKTGITEKIPVANALSIDFTGSGVVFNLKDTNLSPAERVSQSKVLDGLKDSQKAINQLIHIGAHMEGTTDYSKYWQENKHIYLPNIFPDPNKLKEGQTVDGYKYIGGNYRDRKNWVPASSGK